MRYRWVHRHEREAAGALQTQQLRELRRSQYGVWHAPKRQYVTGRSKKQKSKYKKVE